MKKAVIVINGRGGVGKDTLCDFAAKKYAVRNVSSITPIKALAAQCGWSGEKTDRARKFLSDLKALLIEYNDYPTKWAIEEYQQFLKSDEDVMFLHVREGEEIAKFVRETGGRAKTLLIRRAAHHTGAYGNASDDLVEEYDYDYVFDNDLPLAETEGAFLALLQRILAEVTE